MKKENRIIIVILVLSIIGFLIRIKGLFIWPLALDEYYVARSVQNILQKGFPEFDFGGYYVRGLLFQYSSALLSIMGLKVEYAIKILPIIASIFAIPALYKIGKKFLENYLTLAFIFIYLFSIWEVEFTRFARMYLPFQTIFLWYLVFLLNYLFDNSKKSLKWMLLLSFISIFIYEASIFIAFLNLIILLWDTEVKEFNLTIIYKNLVKYRTYNIASIAVILFAIIFISYNFRGVNSSELYPMEFNSFANKLTDSHRFRLPLILIFSLSNLTIWHLVFVVPLGLIIWGAVKILKDQCMEFHTKLFFVISILLILFNLFGLILLLALLFLLFGWIRYEQLEKKMISNILLISVITLISLFVFAVKNNYWLETSFYFSKVSSLGNLKVFIKEGLNYPYVYETFVLFRNTLPRLTLISVSFIILGSFLSILPIFKEDKNQKIIFALFLILFLGVTMVKTGFFETRYFFFLLPIYYLLLILSIKTVIGIAVKKSRLKIPLTFALVVSLFVFTEDFNSKHLLEIDSADINFRKNLLPSQRDHYYPRWDSRFVADIVNKEANKNDIIISDEQISHYYLNRLDYLFRDYRSADFKNESVNHGKNERWTNAKLIYTSDNLLKILSDNIHDKWLIINKTWGVFRLEKEGFFDLIAPYLFASAQDGTTFLYKIPKETNFKNLNE